MKRKSVLGLAFALLLVLAGVYLWGPSQTPPTQKPLTVLSTANFPEFASAFDEGGDAPLLLLLLSPT